MCTREKPYANDKLYKCEVCDKYFSLKYNLNRHVRIHTGEKSYQCNICDKTYNDRSGLTKHERFHTGEKLFKCSYCGKVFADKCKWTYHERVHSGSSSSINGRIYKCEVCLKCFNGKHNYTRHARIHTGEKPYECNFCGKAFADKSDYTKHVRFHTGENLYKCRYCDKRFANRNKLTLHESIHTVNSDNKCNCFNHKDDCTKHSKRENRKNLSIGTARDCRDGERKIVSTCADMNSEKIISDYCKVENTEEIEIMVKCESFGSGSDGICLKSDLVYPGIKSEMDCDHGKPENVEVNVEKKCDTFDMLNDHKDSSIPTVYTAIKIEKRNFVYGEVGNERSDLCGNLNSEKSGCDNSVVDNVEEVEVWIKYESDYDSLF